MAQRGPRGRGAFYKARYGRGSYRRRDTDHVRATNHEESSHSSFQEHGNKIFSDETSPSEVKSWKSLSDTLKRIDGKPYGAYKDLKGAFSNTDSQFRLRVDHVQSDPFAAPSKIAIQVRRSAPFIPKKYFETSIHRVAVADYLTRMTADFLREKALDQNFRGSGWSGPKGGAFNINAPGQEVLLRSSCVVDALKDHVELRLTVSLPARGRTILGQQAHEMLHDLVPSIVENVFLFENVKVDALDAHIACVEQQESLRGQLEEKGLVAFIANGAVLPRASGAASLPMDSKQVKKFKAPPAYEVGLQTLSGSSIVGMGIAKGITVLTGGGFHGKSTLLEAIQMGIYDHIPGDGRELVVTDDSAMKIRAEDGRRITSVDISPFISDLPGHQDTLRFSTDDASGSTSMAANIQEALEVGSKLLLIDEDSSATNLLVRDIRMQNLIKSEPITPFVSKARALYKQHGVSTIIVIGGCGDYLSIADHVIGMDEYLPYDLTEPAKRVIERFPASIEQHEQYGSIPNRKLSLPRAVLGQKPPQVRGLNFVETRTRQSLNAVRNPAEGETGIDLSAIEQLVEPGQLRFIVECLRNISFSNLEGQLLSILKSLEQEMEKSGIDSMCEHGYPVGDLVVARRNELAAAINRLAGIVVQ